MTDGCRESGPLILKSDFDRIKMHGMIEAYARERPNGVEEPRPKGKRRAAKRRAVDPNEEELQESDGDVCMGAAKSSGGSQPRRSTRQR